MSRIYVGSTVEFNTTVKNNGVLTDAPSITFKYKIGRHGEERSITPSWADTGQYYVNITPDASGNLYARWDTDGSLDVVQEPIVLVRRSAFEECNSNDYN